MLNRWAEKGYYASWCDSCGGTTLHCPECKVNACSGVEGCPTCVVTMSMDGIFWDEIKPIEDALVSL